MGTKYEKSLTFNIYAKNGPNAISQIFLNFPISQQLIGILPTV